MGRTQRPVLDCEDLDGEQSKVCGAVWNLGNDGLLGLEEYCWDMARSKIDETVWRTIGGANQQDRFAEIADMCARPCLRAAMSASTSSGQTPEIIDAHF